MQVGIFKKIISMVVAAITTAAICVTAMASSSEHGSVDIDQQEKYWRSFKATTTNSEPVDIIYAGIQCLRLDNGAPASENILEPDYNTDEVYATVSVDYSSYPMLVRAFSSHSAHKNGKMIFDERNLMLYNKT